MNAKETVLAAVYGAPDRPLKIGSIEIPCYVLEGDIRVLSQRGLQTGIGMSISGGSAGEQRMPRFIDSIAEKGTMNFMRTCLGCADGIIGNSAPRGRSSSESTRSISSMRV